MHVFDVNEEVNLESRSETVWGLRLSRQYEAVQCLSGSLLGLP